jgi:AcrR family transcriptional regulator
MGRRNDHTRNEIKEMAIKAELELIEEGGFQNCSARKVAARIGYSAGTLYNVFEDYDDLVLHANAVTLDDLKDYVEKNLDRDLEGVEALKRVGVCYIEFAHENDFRWKALFDYRRPTDTELPQWYLSRLNSLFAIGEKLILPLVQGDFESAQRVTQVLWAGVHGICSLGLTQRLGQDGTELLKTMSDSLIENYLRGLNQTKENS